MRSRDGRAWRRTGFVNEKNLAGLSTRVILVVGGFVSCYTMGNCVSKTVRWSTETVRELVMNAVAWTSRDDMYSSFFEAVGAPPWHGKNLDALWDSFRGGQINKIEVPYRLVFKNYGALSASLKNDAERFIGVIREAAEDGVPVDIRIES